MDVDTKSSLKELVLSILSDCKEDNISLSEVKRLCSEYSSKVDFEVDGSAVFEVLSQLECDRELTRCTLYGYDENNKMQYNLGYCVE